VSVVAVIGAGPVGAAIAHRLAVRSRVSEVRLIDANSSVAAGKALDIQQAGPVSGSDVRLTTAADPLAASGASVIVIADSVDAGEWRGAEGLTLVEQLARAGTRAPLVFAGPTQLMLMEEAYRTAKIPKTRLIGSAASAAAGIVQSLAGLEAGLSSIELTVVGRPPGFVIGWSAASVSGCLVTDRVPAHRLLAMSQTLPRLWPPGPIAIASATAPIVEGLIHGSRRLHPALTVVDGELGARGSAVMLPLVLGLGRILSHVMPSLSPQERTELTNQIAS
jgi:malate dehydrogenase